MTETQINVPLVVRGEVGSVPGGPPRRPGPAQDPPQTLLRVPARCGRGASGAGVDHGHGKEPALTKGEPAARLSPEVVEIYNTNTDGLYEPLFSRSILSGV